jgi:pseudaminic acid synthase
MLHLVISLRECHIRTLERPRPNDKRIHEMSNQPSSFKIGDRLVGSDSSPFIIAEMSGNHNQSLDRAIRLVDAAAASGAHALKLQTYTADTMTLNVSEGDFVIKDPDSPWYGRNLHDLYQEAHTPWSWHREIFDRAKVHGMLAFSTPFDETAVEFLESLDVPCYKIASFENTDLPLIERTASTGKPLIISTGMASLEELDECVLTARNAGCRDLVLLKCTSTYPASAEDSNILTIPDMRKRFGCQIGLSDHTMGCGVAVASVALGATVIEKHFALRRADGGVDSSFSMEPEEFAVLTKEAHNAWLAMGRVHYGSSGPREEKSKSFRRSLYFAEAATKGTAVARGMVRSVRPGHGLPTKFLNSVIGKKLTCDVRAGTPVSWELLS